MGLRRSVIRLVLLAPFTFGCASQGVDVRYQAQPDSRPVNNSSTPRANRPDSALYFINTTAGWVLVRGTLYTTVDGKKWNLVNRRDLTDCKSVTFMTQSLGWALCDAWATPRRSNYVLSTRNGGESWQKVLEVPSPIHTVDFINTKVGFVSSRWYPLHRSIDGGNTWTQADGVEGLHYLFFLDDKMGWGYGSGIWYTDNAGNSWKQVIGYKEAEELWSADFPDLTSGWIVGKNQVWHVSPSETLQQTEKFPPNLQFLTVSSLDHDEGWIGADDGSIFHTTDAGSTWQVIAKLSTPLSSIKFLTRDKGWALNVDGDLLFSDDKGLTWQKKVLPTE